MPESLLEDLFIAWQTMERDNTPTGREITLMDWKDTGGYLKRKLASKGGIRREKLHLYLGEYVGDTTTERTVIK